MSEATLSAPWAGASVATVIPLLLHWPIDPPEATTSAIRLNQIKLPIQWRGYEPPPLSSEGIGVRIGMHNHGYFDRMDVEPCYPLFSAELESAEALTSSQHKF